MPTVGMVLTGVLITLQLMQGSGAGKGTSSRVKCEHQRLSSYCTLSKTRRAHSGSPFSKTSCSHFSARGTVPHISLRTVTTRCSALMQIITADKRACQLRWVSRQAHKLWTEASQKCQVNMAWQSKVVVHSMLGPQHELLAGQQCLPC